MSIEKDHSHPLLGNGFLNEITALRLQPLVVLNTGRTFAYEVLSKTKDHNPEQFFSMLPANLLFEIFSHQIKILRNVPGQFWFNLPVDVFTDPSFISQLAETDHQGRFILEIQNPAALVNLTPQKLENFRIGIQSLRNKGWSIWLDDITYELAPKIAQYNLDISGIKIDRSEVINNSELIIVVHTARKMASQVLIEGIETDEMLQKAYNANADFGQGFLWEETQPIPFKLEQ